MLLSEPNINDEMTLVHHSFLSVTIETSQHVERTCSLKRSQTLVRVMSVTVPCVIFGQNGKSRLQQAQDDVEAVKDIMLDNLKKADERSERLDDLGDRADELLEKVTRSC